MKRLLVLAASILGIVAILVAFGNSPHETWALLPAIPFLIGTTHSSLVDQADIRTAFPSQLLTGAGGAQNGNTLDSQGYEEVTFVLDIGVITGSGAIDAYVQSGANSNASDMANIANTAITQIAAAANGNVVATISVGRPTNRYLRLVVNQTVNNVQAAAIAILYRRSGVNPSANVGGATQTPVQNIRLVQN